MNTKLLMLVITTAITLYLIFSTFSKTRKRKKNKQKAEKVLDIKLMTKEEFMEYIDENTNEDVSAVDAIMELYKEKTLKRYEYFVDSKFEEGNVINKDLLMIMDYMLEDFGKYQEKFVELAKTSKNPEIRFAASTICIRSGVNTKNSIENLKKFGAGKKDGLSGMLRNEARKYLKMYNGRTLPALDGYNIQFKERV